MRKGKVGECLMANDTRDRTRELQHELYRAAKESPTRRFHALYDKVHRADVLGRAWSEVAANGGAPGVDGVSITQVQEQGVEDFLDTLRVELETGCYRPLPVRRVTIPKASGGTRNLGVPAVRDRVVQAAAKLVCEPIFEADFLDCSYGFRPKRSAQQALEAIRVGVNGGRTWVVDADIASFFDSIPREVLRSALGGADQRPADDEAADGVAAGRGMDRGNPAPSPDRDRPRRGDQSLDGQCGAAPTGSQMAPAAHPTGADRPLRGRSGDPLADPGTGRGSAGDTHRDTG